QLMTGIGQTKPTDAQVIQHLVNADHQARRPAITAANVRTIYRTNGPENIRYAKRAGWRAADDRLERVSHRVQASEREAQLHKLLQDIVTRGQPLGTRGRT